MITLLWICIRDAYLRLELRKLDGAQLASGSNRTSSAASTENPCQETKRVAGEMAIWAARLAAVRDGSYEMQRMKEQKAWRVFREKHDRWSEDM